MVKIESAGAFSISASNTSALNFNPLYKLHALRAEFIRIDKITRLTRAVPIALTVKSADYRNIMTAPANW
jgi:hypothetical protein